MKRSALLLPALLSSLLLAACHQQSSADAGSAASPGATDAQGDTPSAAAEAAAASAAAAEGAQAPTTDDAAAAAQAPADDTAADAATPDPTAPVEGRDYAVIRGGQPYLPLNGKIEVVEVFGYVCPACAQLEPVFSAWERRLPADVRVSFVPAPFGPQWIPYAKAFYVADSLGLVAKTHTPLFHAIHIENSLPGEGETPDEAAIARWYGKYGANPKQFLAAMDSFATDAKVKRGTQFMMRSGVGGTPTIIVDGKYRVTGGRTYKEVLDITEHLVQMERDQMERAAAGASAAD
jgi:thiol:disulfide interchange protein DsbA